MKKLVPLIGLVLFVFPLIAQESSMFALYRCPTVGMGTWGDAYRPKVSIYIPYQQTDRDYWNSHNKIANTQIVAVKAPASVLDSIDSDIEIQRISPRCDSEASFLAWVDGNQSGIESNGKVLFEQDGCSMAWTSESSSVKSILRYVLKCRNMGVNVFNLKDADLVSFLKSNMDTKVSQIPLATRTKVKTWIESKGIDTAWIVASTTVRQVLHYVLENIDWPTGVLGPIDLR